ncbi:HAD-like protein [Glarea lozoyensis ATCC 20868]|uniref:HAD-like protein n=1 Tax=Glarea lozoyensis (strain ATCC 20868 / MF5171) TaxID=1116229 RepID=S3DI43_GLAL2|nr:HAD-like protein [Glarea lozoyensis ATCC 20868]EPE31706.1 HAD-like protein [Glarea lozoyensis ATCC 20868]
MGVPGSSHGDTFHEWAQLPIPRAQFREELREQQILLFPECIPLPGVEKLLKTLKDASNINDDKIHMALASSTETPNFKMKTTNLDVKNMFNVFDANNRVLGDDPRLGKGRGKPAPDIFLLALKCINESLPSDQRPIEPQECLVFEDSVPGVEAGRRAKMRVVWVPHAALAAEYMGKERDVLSGRVGLVKIGDEHQLGEVDDGWGRSLTTLENFPYRDYGI